MRKPPENRAPSRRDFLRSMAAGSAVVAGVPQILSASQRASAERLRSRRRLSWNDQIQVAVIGAGGMGMIDVGTALRIPGVQLVAACDVYDGRLTSARDEYGEQVFTSRDYREILARDDVDAVILATPDHWHQRISIDALRAGKAVYCEKPMVHRIEQGMDLVRAQQETGITFQVGSQGMSSLGNEKARELFQEGAIGQLNYAEGFWARNSPSGAWQYAIPEDASEETVDWDRFLGDAPQRSFDPLRIFRWRNYRDYGTGVSGDLFVHLFSSLHFIVSSTGTETHPPFNLSLRVNFVDGTSGSTFLRLVGSEGAMDVTWTEVILRKNKASDPMDAFAQAKTDELDAALAERKQMLPPVESRWVAEDGVRNDAPVREDAVFGLRAAAPALACNDSYFEERIVRWDPGRMELVE